MNWYYSLNGQQAGPVTDEELAPLIQSGAIAPATLVWHSGLAGWQPFAEAGATLPQALRPAVDVGGLTVGAEQALCSQCGQVFPADEVVQVGGYNVCGACKPLLLQKLQQGVMNAGVYGVQGVRYAGFWIRFAAAIVDWLILLMANLLLNFLFGLVFRAFSHANPLDPSRSQFNSGVLIAVGRYWAVILTLTATYNGIFLSRFGGLPGMLLCGFRVVRPDGARITFWRGVARFLANYLNTVTLCLGYLIIVFDEQKRALHDYVCDTRVIYK